MAIFDIAKLFIVELTSIVCCTLVQKWTKTEDEKEIVKIGEFKSMSNIKIYFLNSLLKHFYDVYFDTLFIFYKKLCFYL